ncbi:MAG: ComEA family DNA-binding protein [Erysipelotrichaceae bacterium]|jgi:competence protein ComEA|uniref:ComEA family DNA-binding protein n=1 Tax=Lactimicrobium sp. TaxID=2563780 RepID=UPI002F355228|nr:ComEA family DNA-binding protein [Erysipelotrichaceae bacterium]MCI1326623.1 ComEA family DNA-binding protein [Solobacterium sp.]MCH4044953.1 ComEA family DNA-binding protein [Erysipelotrichaceae bacterium]MCH4122165.1 ComEA family DNA-binding protein [Erysipelotrichaceae bacterium]MCI1364056.1 ComEA family DNA-binding protein [Solobacterium sp.]
MKQTLIFIAMIALALCIDLSPVDLAALQNDMIHVSISGEVLSPGDYELPLYSSLNTLLETAGTTDSSDLSGLNPDTILKDHDRIIVPAVSEHAKAKVSINTADLETLTTLPGIGPSTAARIIAFREENGLFQQLEDLMKVKGIGPSKFEKVKEYISL